MMDLQNEHDHRNTFLLALGFGAIAGSRAFTAPAMLSHFLHEQPEGGLATSKLRFIRSSLFTKVTGLLASGEILGDKFEETPDRIQAGGILMRCLAGAVAGAAIYSQRREVPWQGALIGGGAALVSTYLTFFLRKKSTQGAKISNKLTGLAEDLAVVGTGMSMREKFNT